MLADFALSHIPERGWRSLLLAPGSERLAAALTECGYDVTTASGSAGEGRFDALIDIAGRRGGPGLVLLRRLRGGGVVVSSTGLSRKPRFPSLALRRARERLGRAQAQKSS